MKKTIRINFFALLMTMVFVTIAHSQQRPSQRSFVSVMAQVKQKQIARDKMMQQIKQTTPSGATPQNRNIQVQPTTRNAATQQRSPAVPQTNQQPAINRQATQQMKNKNE